MEDQVKMQAGTHIAITIEEYERLKNIASAWDSLNKRQGKSQYFYIIKSEWERLKRLEENVKKNIKEIKKELAKLHVEETMLDKQVSEQHECFLVHVGILLESLYE